MLSEGERGLLGVGYTPARVLASVDADAVAAETGRRSRSTRARPQRACAALLEHVAAALGIRCRIEIAEDDEGLTATCSGDELGLLIGKHGATIDAVQVLAGAIAARGARRADATSSSTRPATATAAAGRSRRSRCAAPRRRCARARASSSSR